MATIRIAHSSDSEAIAQLTSQLGYEISASAAAERLADILSRPSHVVLVAESDGRVSGWVHASAEIGLETGAFVRIGGLVVDSPHRGKGIGRALMAQAEDWAERQGLPVVRLVSSAARTNAHEFYRRLGYATIKMQYSFVKVLGPDGDDLRRFVPRV